MRPKRNPDIEWMHFKTHFKTIYFKNLIKRKVSALKAVAVRTLNEILVALKGLKSVVAIYTLRSEKSGNRNTSNR